MLDCTNLVICMSKQSSESKITLKLLNVGGQGHEGVVVVMDNLLIFGATREEHDSHLNAVLRTIRDSSLNKAKCHFGKSEIQYIGHIINAEGMKPGPSFINSQKL